MITKIYRIIILFVILILCLKIFPIINENFEQVKIKLKPNPINLNVNNSNNNTCNNYPDVVVPVYAPWRTYYPASIIYPYYPFYPFYYNNYFLPE